MVERNFALTRSFGIPRDTANGRGFDQVLGADSAERDSESGKVGIPVLEWIYSGRREDPPRMASACGDTSSTWATARERWRRDELFRNFEWNAPWDHRNRSRQLRIRTVSRVTQSLEAIRRVGGASR
jgi:hypothetical protein